MLFVAAVLHAQNAVQYEVIKDFGIFAGYDTFNGFKIGASVLFN